VGTFTRSWPARLPFGGCVSPHGVRKEVRMLHPSRSASVLLAGPRVCEVSSPSDPCLSDPWATTQAERPGEIT
jgi:hypothetical protein